MTRWSCALGFLMCIAPSISRAQGDIEPSKISAIANAAAKSVRSSSDMAGSSVAGTFVDAIPIALPEGRHGMRPNLALAYDSADGNGLCGMGWKLIGLPAIARMRFGRDISYQGTEATGSTDTFVFLPSGWGSAPAAPNRLVRASTTYGPVYHLAHDNMSEFKAIGWCGSGPCYWAQRDGRGNTYYFGQTQQNTASLSYTTPPCAGLGYDADVCEVQNRATTLQGPRGIEAWLLQKVVDPYGNRYRVQYAGDASSGTRVPSLIRYTEHETETTATFEVLFETETRADFTPVPNRHQQRLKKIVVRSRDAAGATAGVVRTYLVGYESSPASGRSRLTSFQEEAGFAGSVAPPNLPKLPAQIFAYTDGGNPSSSPLAPIVLDPGNLISLEDENDFERELKWNVLSGDFNGDGLADIVRIFQGNTGYRVQDNVPWYQEFGEVLYARPAGFSAAEFYQFSLLPAIEYWNPEHELWAISRHSFVGDVNGDGFDDVLIVDVTFEEIWVTYALGSSTGLWPVQSLTYPHQFVRQEEAGPLDTLGFLALTGDVDGDQKQDIIITSNYPFEEPTARGGGVKAQVIHGSTNGPGPATSLIFPQATFSAYSPSRRAWLRGASVTDIDGDGRGDLVLAYSSLDALGENESALGTGEIAFAYAMGDSALGLANPQIKVRSVDSVFWWGHSLLAGDINGDGRQDVLMAYTGREGHFDPPASNIVPNPMGPEGIEILEPRVIPHGRDIRSLFGPFSGSLVDRVIENGASVAYGYPWRTLDEEMIPETHLAPYGQLPADLNGDGIADILTAYRGYLGTRIDYSLMNQLGEFRSPTGLIDVAQDLSRVYYTDAGNGLAPWADGKTNYWQYPRTADINGDGNADLLLIRPACYGVDNIAYALGHAATGLRRTAFDGPDLRSLAGYGGLNSGNPACSNLGGVPLIADFNGDGKQDVAIVPDRTDHDLGAPHALYAFSTGTMPDRLRSITNNFGSTVEVTYQNVTALPGAIARANQTCTLGDPSAPLEDGVLHRTHQLCGAADSHPREVVTEIRRLETRGPTTTTRYSYQNGRILLGSIEQRASLGFESTTTTHVETGVTEEADYRQDQPYEGQLWKRTTTVGTSLWKIEKHAFEAWAGWDTSSALIPPLQIPAVNQTAVLREPRIAIYAFESNTPTGLTEIRREFDALHQVKSVEECVDAKITGDCITTRYSYDDDLGQWLLWRTRESWTHKAARMIDMHRYTFSPTHWFELASEERRLFDDSERADCSGDPRSTAEGFCPPKPGWRWVIVSQDHHYDGFGNETRIADAGNNATEYTPDAAFKTFTYETRNALGHRTHYEYDYAGRLRYETDVENNVEVETRYDGFGRVKSRSRPYSTTSGRPANPPLREERDYVLWGTAPTISSKSTDKNTQNVRVTTWVETGKSRFLEQYFNGAGVAWATREDSSSGDVYAERSETFDTNFSSAVTYSRPHFSGEQTPTIHEIRFDSLARPTSARRFIRAANGSETMPEPIATFLYSPLYGGRHTTVTDAGGYASDSLRDGRDRVLWIRDANHKSTTYGYDSASRISQVDLPNGDRFSRTYDTLGRLRSETDASTGTRTFDYYDSGDLLLETDQLGAARSYAYDGLHRLTAEWDGARRVLPSTHSFQYDSLASAMPPPERAVGRIVRVSDPSGWTEFSYDVEGHVKRRIQSISGLGNQTFAFSYDGDGQITNKTLPNGKEIIRGFNGDGTAASIRLATNEVSATFSQYTALRQVGQRWVLTASPTPLGTVTTTNYGYNDNHNGTRLATLHTETGAHNVLQDFEYKYDSVGNVENIGDLRDPSLKSVNNVTTDETQKFDHDPLRRLTHSTSMSTYGTLDYDYDEIGNLKAKAGVTYSYSSPKCPPARRCIEGLRVGSTVFLAEHDLAGRRVRMTEDRDGDGITTEWLYAYNSQGNLASVTRDGGQLLSIAYDYRGRRAKKVFFHSPGSPTSATTTSFYVDSEYEVRVSSQSPGQESVTIHLGGEGVDEIATLTMGGVLASQPTNAAVSAARGLPLSGSTARGLPAGVFVSLSNRLGTTNVVLDASLGEVTRLLTTPHGELLRNAHFGSLGFDLAPKKFTGKDLDSESGLTYFGARYYDELTGRFITADPTIPGDLRNPQGFNRFSYVYNNPVRYVDPTGLAPEAVEAFRLAALRRIVVVGGNVSLFFGTTTQYTYENTLADIDRDIARLNASDPYWAHQGDAFVMALATLPLTLVGSKVEPVEGATILWGKKPPVVVLEEPGLIEPPTRLSKVPNPRGQNGNPDHVETVRQLVDKAKAEFPNSRVVENRKLPAETGVNRRPDVSVRDPETGEVQKVYEAARTNKDGTFVSREMKKQAEYDAAGIPSHFEPVK